VIEIAQAIHETSL